MLKTIKPVMVRTSIALYIGALGVLFLSTPAFAAQLQPQMSTDARVGEQLVVPMVLNSTGENINAIEGFLHYDSSLTLREIRDGNSVIAFWVERPTIETGVNGDTFVHFSGITPGGFVGQGEIFSLVFTVSRPGAHTFNLSAARALLNDGKGTETTLTMGKTITTTSLQQAPAPADDQLQPDAFVPTVSADPNLYDGKQVVIFATQDKGSGVDHYEVAEREGFKTLFVGELHYVRATSPYVLTDQNLHSYIYVKAVDRAGNERVAILSPEHLPLYYNVDLLAFILVVLLLCVASLWRYAKRTRR